MGGAPYKSAKGGVGGRSFKCFCINHERVPMSSNSYSIPSKQIIGQTTTYNKATSVFEVNA